MSAADYDLHDDDARLEPEFQVKPRSFLSALVSSVNLGPTVAEALCFQLFTTIHQELAQSGRLIIHGFGTFTFHPWRTRDPLAPHPLWCPVEVPYPGPVEFQPAKTLLLQLDEGVLNTRTLFTADVLVPPLRDVPGLPPAASGQILRVIFLILTDLLLVEHSCTLPKVGTFVRTRKPTFPQVDPSSGIATPRIYHHVTFAASPDLVRVLPSTWRTPPREVDTPGEVPLTTLLAFDPEGEMALLPRDDTDSTPVDPDDTPLAPPRRVPILPIRPESTPLTPHEDADLPDDPEGL